MQFLSALKTIRLAPAITNEKLYLRRTMMTKSTFVLLLACCLSLSLPAQGEVTMTPLNLQVDPCDMTFSFDLAIMDPDGVSARAFQATIGSTFGPDPLTLDKPSSKVIASEANYWLYGNSGGIVVEDNLGGSYTFGDYPSDASAVPLAADDLMARFAFGYDTPGDYIFSLDLDPLVSFIQDESFDTHAFLFDPGLNPDFLPGGSNWFTITPEPATLMLFGLGTAVLLRKRRA